MRFLAGLFFHSSKNIAFPVSLVAGLALLITGCGSSGPSGGPVAGGITTVAIQLSSTANDQLTLFTMSIQSITLTSRAGKTTTIFSTPTNVDFIRANRSEEHTSELQSRQ